MAAQDMKDQQTATPPVVVSSHSPELSKDFALKHPAVVSTTDIAERNKRYWEQ